MPASPHINYQKKELRDAKEKEARKNEIYEGYQKGKNDIVFLGWRNSVSEEVWVTDEVWTEVQLTHTKNPQYRRI